MIRIAGERAPGIVKRRELWFACRLMQLNRISLWNFGRMQTMRHRQPVYPPYPTIVTSQKGGSAPAYRRRP